MEPDALLGGAKEPHEGVFLLTLPGSGGAKGLDRLASHRRAWVLHGLLEESRQVTIAVQEGQGPHGVLAGDGVLAAGQAQEAGLHRGSIDGRQGLDGLFANGDVLEHGGDEGLDGQWVLQPPQGFRSRIADEELLIGA